MHHTIFDTPVVNVLMYWISRSVLRLAGWRLIGAAPTVPKYVLIAAPHTSNWDFPVTLMICFALRLKVYWMGKSSLFPPLMGVPGIKLGLSNGVLIFAVYMLSLPTAWVLMLLKVVLSSLFLGGVAALPYALAGGVLSLASMCLLSRMKWMHPVTVSIVGGVMHNVGQIVMAMIILHTSQLAYYMAVLMLSGILFGALTGVSATLVMKHMKHIKWGK